MCFFSWVNDVNQGNILPNPSREAKFSGVITNGDRGKSIFPVQLTTSRIDNLTQLILLLLYITTAHTYIIPVLV